MHFVIPTDSHVLSPLIFKYQEWQKSLDQVNSILENNTFDLNNTKQTLQGLIDTMIDSKENIKMQSNLIDYLDKLDKRRNQNWRKTFQWLTEYENVV